MFDRTADPIANVPVYKRVQIGADEPQPCSGQFEIKSTAQICQEIAERAEANRIWNLVKDTASGTCMPISSPSSTGSLTDCDDTVCTDGWEAA